MNRNTTRKASPGYTAVEIIIALTAGFVLIGATHRVAETAGTQLRSIQERIRSAIAVQHAEALLQHAAGEVMIPLWESPRLACTTEPDSIHCSIQLSDHRELLDIRLQGDMLIISTGSTRQQITGLLRPQLALIHDHERRAVGLLLRTAVGNRTGWVVAPFASAGSPPSGAAVREHRR